MAGKYFNFTIDPIPKAAGAEDPGYYRSLFNSHGKSLDLAKEIHATIDDFLSASRDCYQAHLTKPGEHFTHNDTSQMLLEQPASLYGTAEGWMRRQEAVKTFEEDYVRRSAVASGAYLQNPATRIAGAFERKTSMQEGSFACIADGLVMRTWNSASAARSWGAAARRLWQACFDLRLWAVRVPVVAVVTHRCTVFTMTAAVPIVPGDDAIPDMSDEQGALIKHELWLLAKHLKIPPEELDDATLGIRRAGDGRHYITNFTPLLAHPISCPPNSDLGTFLRPEAYEHLPPWSTDKTPDPETNTSLLLANVAPLAAQALVAAVDEYGADLPSIHRDGVVARSLHSVGLNLRFFHAVHRLIEDAIEQEKSTGEQHPGFRADKGTLEGCLAALKLEMACRTVKDMIRVEILQCLHEDEALHVQRINRLLSTLVNPKSGAWDSQLMPILRKKYDAPKDFTVKVSNETVKSLASYVSGRLGVAFDPKKKQFVAFRSVAQRSCLFSPPAELCGALLPVPDKLDEMVGASDSLDPTGRTPLLPKVYEIEGIGSNPAVSMSPAMSTLTPTASRSPGFPAAAPVALSGSGTGSGTGSGSFHRLTARRSTLRRQTSFADDVRVMDNEKLLEARSGSGALLPSRFNSMLDLTSLAEQGRRDSEMQHKPLFADSEVSATMRRAALSSELQTAWDALKIEDARSVDVAMPAITKLIVLAQTINLPDLVHRFIAAAHTASECEKVLDVKGTLEIIDRKERVPEEVLDDAVLELRFFTLSETLGGPFTQERYEKLVQIILNGHRNFEDAVPVGKLIGHLAASLDKPTMLHDSTREMRFSNWHDNGLISAFFNHNVDAATQLDVVKDAKVVKECVKFAVRTHSRANIPMRLQELVTMLRTITERLVTSEDQEASEILKKATKDSYDAHCDRFGIDDHQTGVAHAQCIFVYTVANRDKIARVHEKELQKFKKYVESMGQLEVGELKELLVSESYASVVSSVVMALQTAGENTIAEKVMTHVVATTGQSTATTMMNQAVLSLQGGASAKLANMFRAKMADGNVARRGKQLMMMDGAYRIGMDDLVERSLRVLERANLESQWDHRRLETMRLENEAREHFADLAWRSKYEARRDERRRKQNDQDVKAGLVEASSDEELSPEEQDRLDAFEKERQVIIAEEGKAREDVPIAEAKDWAPLEEQLETEWAAARATDRARRELRTRALHERLMLQQICARAHAYYTWEEESERQLLLDLLEVQIEEVKAREAVERLRDFEFQSLENALKNDSKMAMLLRLEASRRDDIEFEEAVSVEDATEKHRAFREKLIRQLHERLTLHLVETEARAKIIADRNWEFTHLLERLEVEYEEVLTREKFYQLEAALFALLMKQFKEGMDEMLRRQREFELDEARRRREIEEEEERERAKLFLLFMARKNEILAKEAVEAKKREKREEYMKNRVKEQERRAAMVRAKREHAQKTRESKNAYEIVIQVEREEELKQKALKHDAGFIADHQSKVSQEELAEQKRREAQEERETNKAMLQAQKDKQSKELEAKRKERAEAVEKRIQDKQEKRMEELKQQVKSFQQQLGRKDGRMTGKLVEWSLDPEKGEYVGLLQPEDGGSPIAISTADNPFLKEAALNGMLVPGATLSFAPVRNDRGKGQKAIEAAIVPSSGTIVSWELNPETGHFHGLVQPDGGGEPIKISSEDNPALLNATITAGTRIGFTPASDGEGGVKATHAHVLPVTGTLQSWALNPETGLYEGIIQPDGGGEPIKVNSADNPELAGEGMLEKMIPGTRLGFGVKTNPDGSSNAVEVRILPTTGIVASWGRQERVSGTLMSWEKTEDGHFVGLVLPDDGGDPIKISSEENPELLNAEKLAKGARLGFAVRIGAEGLPIAVDARVLDGVAAKDTAPTTWGGFVKTGFGPGSPHDQLSAEGADNPLLLAKACRKLVKPGARLIFETESATEGSAQLVVVRAKVLPTGGVLTSWALDPATGEFVGEIRVDGSDDVIVVRGSENPMLAALAATLTIGSRIAFTAMPDDAPGAAPGSLKAVDGRPAALNGTLQSWAFNAKTGRYEGFIQPDGGGEAIPVNSEDNPDLAAEGIQAQMKPGARLKFDPTPDADGSGNVHATQVSILAGGDGGPVPQYVKNREALERHKKARKAAAEDRKLRAGVRRDLIAACMFLQQDDREIVQEEEKDVRAVEKEKRSEKLTTHRKAKQLTQKDRRRDLSIQKSDGGEARAEHTSKAREIVKRVKEQRQQAADTAKARIRDKQLDAQFSRYRHNYEMSVHKLDAAVKEAGMWEDDKHARAERTFAQQMRRRCLDAYDQTVHVKKTEELVDVEESLVDRIHEGCEMVDVVKTNIVTLHDANPEQSPSSQGRRDRLAAKHEQQMLKAASPGPRRSPGGTTKDAPVTLPPISRPMH